MLVATAAGAAAAGSRAPALPGFVDLIDFPSVEANWDRFYQLEDHLGAAFFHACGQGGCARHPTVWPLLLRCAVRRPEAVVAGCTWVIAGSDLQVTAGGSITPDVVIWRCPVLLGEAVGVDAFHAALAGPAPLDVRLPGDDHTLRGRLLGCLATAGSRA